MAAQTPKYTLGETVEDYLIRKFNQRRKYFGNYFRIAQDVYKDIYRTIMPTVLSKYVEVFPADATNKYPYVLYPDWAVKFYGISVTNSYNELLEVFYNDELNVFTKPATIKKCGCTTTDLCDCMDNLEVVITEKIIDDTTYYQKDWVVCCANGDVKQYSEIPVKKYGDVGGSYGNDYGDDYDIISEGANVVVLQIYKNLGRLDTKDCGCPLDTENNQTIIYNKCGCFLGLKPNCCKVFYEKGPIRCTGDMKVSECGTKIYLRDVKTDDGFVIVHGQPDPVKCGEEILVDDFARKAIWFGIEEESILFHPKSNENEKRGATQRKKRAFTELFEYLNPINSKRFFSIPTSELKL
jgi:hypothetical protein